MKTAFAFLKIIEYALAGTMAFCVYKLITVLINFK
jgi:hypothetical protein